MWQVIGQTKAVALLKHQLETEQLPHANLLVGPPRVGKMTLALNLAQALNCEGREPPCGECKACQRVSTRKHPDVQVIELTSEGKVKEKRETKISIDQIKELQRVASTPPYEGRYKVFIINGAEHLSIEAANCLLKTLEEPPPRVVIILLTAKEQDIPPTIASRCQRVELHPLPITPTEGILVDHCHISLQKAELLARLSRGCLGWALSAEQNDELLQERSRILETLIELSNASQDRRLACAGQLASEFTKNRSSIDTVFTLWLGWWRDLLLIKEDNKALITNIDREAELLDQAENHTVSQIEAYIRGIQTARGQLKQNANPRLVLEILMLSMPSVRTPVKSQSGG